MEWTYRSFHELILYSFFIYEEISFTFVVHSLPLGKPFMSNLLTSQWAFSSDFDRCFSFLIQHPTIKKGTQKFTNYCHQNSIIWPCIEVETTNGEDSAFPSSNTDSPIFLFMERSTPPYQPFTRLSTSLCQPFISDSLTSKNEEWSEFNESSTANAVLVSSLRRDLLRLAVLLNVQSNL